MTLNEFSNRWHEIRKKYDILILFELIELYEERYKNKKEKVPIEFIYNELHDEPIYSQKEIKYIIQQAQNLKNEQNQ